MKKIFLTFLSIVTTILFFACSSNKKVVSPQLLAAKEFEQKLNVTENKQIIDVRTAEEFASGYIVGAINIDYNGASFEVETEKLDKTKPTFVYCKAGGRSKDAAALLIKNGFKEVYELKGGIMSWENNDLKLTGKPVTIKVDEAAGLTKDSNKREGLTKSEFMEIAASHKIVIIDFNAVWCGPCRRLTPILESLEKEYTDKIKVVKIDVDKNQSLSQYFRIESIPLLHFYKNGKLINQIEGLPSRANLKYAIEQALK